MIDGNSTWTSGLASLRKQPLYVLVLDDFEIYLCSFIPASVNVATVGGYGVTGYGVTPGFGN